MLKILSLQDQVEKTCYLVRMKKAPLTASEDIFKLLSQDEYIVNSGIYNEI